MTTSQLLDAEIPPSLAEAGLLIGGEWADAGGGRRIDVENPSRREVLGSVARGGAEDVDRAVSAAASAFPAWRALPARDRGALLASIAELYERAAGVRLQMNPKTAEVST